VVTCPYCCLPLFIIHHYLASLFTFFLLLIRPPPSSTLFPYTTLFRSCSFIGTWIERLLHYSSYRSILVPICLKLFVEESFLWTRSEEHTSELQSRFDLVCRLLLEKKKTVIQNTDDLEADVDSE